MIAKKKQKQKQKQKKQVIAKKGARAQINRFNIYLTDFLIGEINIIL